MFILLFDSVSEFDLIKLLLIKYPNIAEADVLIIPGVRGMRFMRATAGWWRPRA